jgi:hypothetical protein
MKKKKSKCGCKHETIREMLGSKLCYENDHKASNMLESHAFQNKKPFKIYFNEEIKVNWNPESSDTEKKKNPFVEQKEYKEQKLIPHMKDLINILKNP